MTEAHEVIFWTNQMHGGEPCRVGRLQRSITRSALPLTRKREGTAVPCSVPAVADEHGPKSAPAVSGSRLRRFQPVSGEYKYGSVSH